MHLGLHKPTTWEEVESLTEELLALENLRHVSPQAYVKSYIEERLAEAHERRHWQSIAQAPVDAKPGWRGAFHRSQGDSKADARQAASI